MGELCYFKKVSKEWSKWYTTSCQNKSFTKMNKAKICPFCGRKVKVVRISNL